MKKLLFIACLILTVMLISCDSHDQDTIESIQSETSLISEELTPQTETEAYDPWDITQNPPPEYIPPYNREDAEPFLFDDVIWLNQPDWDGKMEDYAYSENTLVQYIHLKNQFRAYEDQPEQKYAVTVRYHLPYHSSEELRLSPEHHYAVENGLTWNGLDADTALKLYDQHKCFYHEGKEDFSYFNNDELLCQYLNVIFQDTYAEYRSRGMQVIELYRTEYMMYNPPPVMIIGTKEQILSIKNDDPYLWYVGLAVYHPTLLKDLYVNQTVIDDTHICYNPQAEYNFEFTKWYYNSFFVPEGYSITQFLEERFSGWKIPYYKKCFENMEENIHG